MLAVTSPVALRKQLELFLGPAMGKMPERWRTVDFDSVKQAAIACDTYRTAKGYVVKASSWVDNMDAAMRTVLPVALEVHKVDKETAEIRKKAAWLPECQALLDWRRNRKIWQSNSKEIYGRDFLDMSLEELGWARTYTDQCRTAADMIAKARKYSQTKKTGSLIADDIVYAIEKAEEAARERLEASYPTHLVVMDGERRLPLAYLSARSKMMVGIVNRARELNRSLSTGEMSELTIWADGILGEEDVPDPEKAFARAVKEAMARQVFGSDRADTPSDAAPSAAPPSGGPPRP